MNFRAGLFLGLLLGLAAGVTALLAWFALGPSFRPATAAAKAAPPATVPKVAKEDEFNTVQLTPEAAKRIGVRTAKVERRAVSLVRLFGGDIVVPVGRAITVSAPLAGIISLTEEGMPATGARVKKGQVIFQLTPLLTPDAKANLAAARVDADGQVKNAQTQVDAAQVALNRARRLMQSEAGSRRMFDEAQAQYDLASKTLEAAQARRDVLVRAVSDIDKGTASPVPIEAPEPGVLRTLSAREGQTVPGGGALFEVVDMSQVWVRVPVYVCDCTAVGPGDARIGELVIRPGEKMRAARPVAAPPSANPLAATVDLYYELDNADGQYRPGQRVGVQLPQAGPKTESLVVPWSAVIFDISGGAWVYEQTGGQTYARRRVQVRQVIDEQAVLASGPEAGKRVVVEGAAELYSTEVGFAK